MEIKLITEWVEQAAAAAAALGTIWVGFKKMKKKIKPFFNSTAEIELLNKKLDLICKELTPNGGSSLKDKINKIEAEIKKNTSVTESIFNRQRWIFNTNPIPVFEADKDGNFTWANNSYLTLTGFSIENVIKKGWINSLHEKDREDFLVSWYHAVKDSRNFERFALFVDSKGNPNRCRVVATRADDGGYIGSLLDLHLVDASLL